MASIDAGHLRVTNSARGQLDIVKKSARGQQRSGVVRVN